MDTEVQQYTRKCIFSKLDKFCTFAKPDHFIEISLWKNGEGFDIDLEEFRSQKISLTFGQFKAIKKLIKQLENA